MPGIPTDNIDPSLSINSEISYSSNQKKSGRFFRFRFRFLMNKIVFLLLFFSSIFFVVFSIKKEKTSPYFQLANLKTSCPDFVGRKKQLKLLYKNLILERKKKEMHSPVNIQVLWGKGGFGKTELAIEFANRYFSQFSFIWTFCCDSHEHIQQGYHNLAQIFGILNPQDPPETIIKKVHFFLENHTFKLPWLIIYDNVEEELTHYPQRGGCIIVTSQKKMLNPTYLLEVTPFSQQESLELLEKITREKPGEAMDQLIQDLEGIPLLMNYTAHYIKATPGCNVSDYQKLFSSHILEKEGPLWREMDVNRRYQKSLATSWQFSLKSLERENPRALQFLYLCSYLHPEHICEEWIDDWLGGHLSNKTLLDRQALLMSLLNYGIIRYEKNTKTFSLHRFFQHMIRDSRKPQMKEDLVQAIALLAKHAKDYNFYEMSSWKQGQFWFFQACEVKKWLRAYPHLISDYDDKMATALLYEGVGNWCTFNDRYPEALEANNKVLEIRTAIMKKGAREIARAYQLKGWTLTQLTRCEEALAVCHLAEEVQQNYTGREALDFAYTLNTKGRAYEKQGDYQKAIKFYQDATKIRIDNYGEVHTDVGRNLQNISRCYQKLGQFEEALKLQEKVSEIYLKTCGKNHPLYAWSLENRARVIRDQGKYQEALQLFNQAISILTTSRGMNNGDFAFSWHGIGWCHLHLNNFKQAKIGFKKALEVGLKYYGENSSIVLRSHNGLGWSYLKEGRLRKGLKYLTRTLQKNAKVYQYSSKMIESLEDFQKALKEATARGGKSENITQAASIALQISQDSLGKDHPITRSLLTLTRK